LKKKKHRASGTESQLNARCAKKGRGSEQHGENSFPIWGGKVGVVGRVATGKGFKVARNGKSGSEWSSGGGGERNKKRAAPSAGGEVDVGGVHCFVPGGPKAAVGLLPVFFTNQPSRAKTFAVFRN